MRAFLQGVWAGALGLIGIWGLAWLTREKTSLIDPILCYPMHAENVLSFAPWMLAGGLFSLAWHFHKERRMQFSILLLLLITTLFSLSAARFSLGHSRLRGERQAIVVLLERFPYQGLAIEGSSMYQKIIGVGFSAKAINSDEIPFLMSQLKYFPCLRKVVFLGEERLSEADLATLKAEFPNVVFSREW